MPRRSTSISRRFSRRAARSLAAAEVLEDRTLMTNYVVDTLADGVAADGRVSLREAVQAASLNQAVNEAAPGGAGGGADVITFAPAIAGGTITLTTGFQLNATGPMTIAGPMTISGGGLTTVFATGGSGVELIGLTITGGNGRAGGAGGGIYNTGQLRLVQCVLTGNASGEPSAPGFGGSGGGLYQTGSGDLTVVDCLISNNSSKYGGGVYVGGTARFVRTTFSDNAAARGGGLLTSPYGSSTSVLTDCSLSRNQASGDPAADALGGGVFNEGRTELVRCVVSGGVANLGAGVYSTGVLTVSDSLLTGNVGPQGASVYALHNAGTAAVSGSVLSQNAVGGVINFGTLAMTGGAVYGNAGAGAANGGTLTLTDAAVTWNAGVGVGNSGTLRVSGGRVALNARSGVENKADARVFGCVIFGNGSAGPYGLPIGGGLANFSGATLAVDQCVVSSNIAGLGGGVYNQRGVLTVTASVISGNGTGTAGLGGGVYNQGVATLAGSVVTGNVATAASGGGGQYGYGGGVFTAAGGRTVMGDCTVSNNAAAAGGGVFGNANAATVVSRSTLSGNTAVNGGGVFGTSPDTLEVYDSTISGNYASGVGGGARSTAAVFYNVTIFGNRAGQAGGGLYATARLVNTLVAGNRRGTAGTAGTPDDLAFAASAGSTNNLIGDAATAGGLANGVNGNLVGVDWRAALDPVLRYNGGPTPTHALIAGGPATDAGTTSPFATDQRGIGFPRHVGAAVDIGAFEFGAGATSSAEAALAAFWGRAGEDEAFAGLLASV